MGMNNKSFRLKYGKLDLSTIPHLFYSRKVAFISYSKWGLRKCWNVGQIYMLLRNGSGYDQAVAISNLWITWTTNIPEKEAVEIVADRYQ